MSAAATFGRTTTSTTSWRKAYRLYEERLAAANATDFGGLLLSALQLVPARRPAAHEIARALRSRAGRRVPGHQQRAVPAGAPAVAAHGQHHASSATTTSRSTAGAAPTSATSSTSSATTRARASSSWSRTTARRGNILRRRQRDHREEQRAAAEAPVHRGGRGRADRPVRGRDRARRGRVRRQPHRGGAVGDAARRATSPSSTGPTRSRACWKTRCARAICPTRSSAARASSTAPRSRTWSPTCARSPTRDDGMALQRIINVPARGIGATTVDRIGDIIYEREDLRPGRRWSWSAERRAELLGRGPRKKVAAFVALMAKLRAEGAGARARRRWPRRCWRRAATATRWPATRRMEAEGRIENLLELVAQMREYEREAGGADAARLPRADRAGVRRRRLRCRTRARSR